VTRRLVLAALVLLLPAPVSALEEQIRTIPSRPDVTESFVLIHPSRPPVASVVLFMGGRGALGLQRGPLTPRNTNFLVRTRQRFAEKGFSSPSSTCRRTGRARRSSASAPAPSTRPTCAR
jgi:hypothetical protein